MTGVLGKPQPIPYVDEEDLVNLAADLGHGVFPAGDLYRWYVELLKEFDRLPIGKTKFGMALTEAGWPSMSKYLDGRMTRCWMITKPWARRGQQLLADQLAAEKARNADT